MTLLVFLPALLLLAALLVGRYPGEATLERLRRRASPMLRAPCPARSRPLPQWAWSPCGGRLIALALAGRAPPPGGRPSR
jgi:hypothetical protein